MARRLKGLDLSQWQHALAAVMLARVLWGAWAALISSLMPEPENALEARVPLWPAQLASGEWWQRALVSPWMRYDYEYYERIITRGYSISDGTASFHPGFPLVAKPFFWLSGNAQASLLLASTLSAWAATMLLARYVGRFEDDGNAGREGRENSRFANVAAWMLLLNPLGWILLAPYTEGTFLAFCIASLWAMRERRLWLGAVLAMGATLARQQGILLLAPLFWELWRHRRPQESEPQVLARTTRPFDWLCLGLIPLAFASYSLLRVFVVREPLDTGRGLGAYLASWIVSPSTRLVVPGSGLAPPWRAMEESLFLIRTMDNPYHVFIDAIAGWSMVAILLAGWKYLHASEKWLCAGVVASSVCFSAQAYMSFPRHLMLAFPLSILAARWSVQSGRARLALEAMMIGGLVLCAGFVRHGWVP